MALYKYCIIVIGVIIVAIGVVRLVWLVLSLVACHS